MGKVIGIVIVLLVAAFFAVLTCRSKKSDLFKWIGILFFIAFAFTWVIPYGYFQSGVYSDYQMSRLGFGDIPTILYYALNFCTTTLIYLFAVAGLYGVLAKTNSYKSLVNGFAKGVEKQKVLWTIIFILFFAGLTTLAKSSLIMFIFVPFAISVLLNAKFDKVTAMGITFGSILVGMLGAVYGTDGLYYFNYYMSLDVTTGLGYRAIIFGIAVILFGVYNVIRVIKVVKKNKIDDTEADLFLAGEEKLTSKKVVRVLPSVIILIVLLLLVLVGGIDWETIFGIDWFTQFHEWLTSLAFGEDFTFISYLLGTSAVALGQFEISTFIIILIFAAILVGINNRMSLSEFGEAYAAGFRKFLKPIVLYTLSYTVFIICYITPFMPWIANELATKSFNPYLQTLCGIITSIFHVDLGYTGYSLGSILTTNYADYLDIAHTLYVATYGLDQLFLPTSGLVLVGLAYLKLDYKKWFKYIWIFAAAMLLVILLFATVVTYWI